MRDRRRSAETWFVAGMLALGVACAPRPPLPEPVVPAPPAGPAVAACALAPGGPPVQTMAVGEPVVAARAPRPVTGAERTVFRQVYDTLLRLDCEGALHPGIAVTWTRQGDGDDWVVELDASARFADGSPVRAGDVVAGWRAGDGGWHAAVSRIVGDVTVLDARTLLVSLRDAQGEAPRALADAALAVAKPVPGAPWPAGTRGRMVFAGDAGGNGEAQVLVLSPGADVIGAGAIRVTVAPARDPRDFLDQHVDLLLTRDAPALAYAGTLDRYERHALPWQRTYVWISAAGDRAVPRPAPDALERLAATAVRGEARAAGGPSWWVGETCGLDAPRPGPTPPAAGDRIVYDAGDEVARQIAERIVALARGGGSEAAALLPALLPLQAARAVQRAVGLSRADLERALSSGSERGYVMAIDYEPVLPCAVWRGMRAAVPWLDAGAIVPLVDTRLYALVRGGLSAGVVDGDGTLRLGDGVEP